MITSFDVQKALIARFKLKAALLVVTSDEIRESQWQGDKFSYPNIRIPRPSVYPYRKGCGLMIANFDVLVHSSLASSQESQDIASRITTTFHDTRFTSLSVRFTDLWTVEPPNPPTYFVEREGVWRSVVRFRALVS